MPSKEAYILVDFDNLGERGRQKQLRELVESLVAAAQLSLVDHCVTHLEVRLYGGWFEETNLTRRAEQLLTQIMQRFPYLLRANQTRIRITASLARSLICEPSRPLRNTHRVRARARGVYFCSPRDEGCNAASDGDCSLMASIEEFVKSSCSAENCRVKPSRLFRRSEQKIVDTLLTSDLLYLALKAGASWVGVVSADDDFWPGIRTAASFGTAITHLFPRKPDHHTHAYTQAMPNGYDLKIWEP